MEIMKASAQWANRPADERFWDLQALYRATKQHRENAATSTVGLKDLRVEAIDGDVQLVGRTGATAGLTHWAFGQLSGMAGAPASYLRTLPATLAVQNLNHGLKRESDQRPDAEAKLLLHKNGGYFTRAINSKIYTRVWNYTIVERLMRLEANGWKVPPAYARVKDGMVSWRSAQLGLTPEVQRMLDAGQLRLATEEQAKLSLTIQPGDLIGPAGLYASFEDMFVFMVNPERVIKDGSESGLIRGFIMSNSEVGKAKYKILSFYFRGACGNHIIWNASNVKEIAVRHVGNADERAFEGLEIELKKYADESATEIEEKIQYARKFVLKGKTKDEVLDFIFNMDILTKKDAEAAYEAVNEDVDGAAYTAYGYAQGITRLSQREKNADTRVELDKAAAAIIEVAF